MSSHVIYACHCLNIRIHLSTKYTLGMIDKIKGDHFVQEPFPGWEFDLGMGGIVIEFNTLIHSLATQSRWNTVKCLNCNSGNIYSVANLDHKPSQTIIHKDAICGQAFEDLKNQSSFSKTFNINLENSIMKDLISTPDPKDVPDTLVSTYKKMQTVLDQSIEQMRIESRVRIEQFKKEEEKKLQSFITLARLENDKLWTKIVKISKEEKAKLPSLDVEQPPLIKRKENNESSNNHVRFAPELNNYQDQPHPKSLKRASFTLDNTAISSLRNMNLENQILPSDKDANLVEESHDDEDEDIFNLDEEFSDEEDKESKNDDGEKEDDLDYAEDGERENNQLLISASLKNSISQIDRKFSWIKKKRNTSKYIPHDFDIRSNFKREDADSNNNEKPVTIYATSMPITIHYPINEDIKEKEKEEEEETNKTNKMRKNDILASSFANYNISSFSDKQLSDQFPAPRRRKSLATSSSLIRPQLDSVVGKSLDTRGLLKKKVNEAEPNYASDDDFDSSLPPHVWAAMETIDENNADE